MNRIAARIGIGTERATSIAANFATSISAGIAAHLTGGLARLSAGARAQVAASRRRIGRRAGLRRGLGQGLRLGVLGGGAAAVSFALCAAMPAGAQTQPLQYVLPGQQAGVTLTIKAGPVTYSGATLAVAGAQIGPFRAQPRFATSVGHFAVAQLPTRPQQIVAPSGNAYGCPPWGSSSYSVPLYDYRADRYARRGYAYGYNYGYGYAQGVAAGQQAAAVASGAFNEPAGYTYVGLTETPRPSFEPLIVRIAGAPAKSGPMPVVHRPAGKNYIHID